MGRGLLLLACVAAAGLTATPASAQLRTGIMDPKFFKAGNYEKDFDHVTKTGASHVRLVLTWRAVANKGEPTDPANPGSAKYNWAWFDQQVRAANARNLDVIATVVDAPDWAHQRTGTPSWNPYPDKFAEFATAAATRYSGSFTPTGGTTLPRIRYWHVWNEPNRDYFLMPQIVNRVVVSARHYRKLVNAFAQAVRDVPLAADQPPNTIIAGGLAPLGRRNKPAPIRFMKELFKWPVKFDIWSHHPYTSGGPTHKAAGAGNVTLGSLGRMRKLLQHRVRNNKVVTDRNKVQFWVTEFSWDTKPPDPKALPMKLHARWTSEALYRMWKAGVTSVTWFKIRDEKMGNSYYQSGLYRNNRAPKRSLTAFRFPFVALRLPFNRIHVWGRTPTSENDAKVAIQIRVGKRWRWLATLNANHNGIFKRTIKTPRRNNLVRARYLGQLSVPFSLKPVQDRWVNPFGCGGTIRC